MRLATLILSALLAASAAGAGTSPRNGLISFWSDRDAGRAQVYVMNPDGSGQRRLTNLFSAKRADWSPDGSRIVLDGRGYATLFDFDIFVARADGSGIRRVTRGPARDTQATWSPDSRWIAFARTLSEGATPSLWLVHPDGTRPHPVARGGPAAWSPDGKLLALGGLGLRLIRPDGSQVRTLRSVEAEPVAWSADGRRILFTGWSAANSDVYVIGADGKGLRRLTRSPGEDLAADFSPDGTRILFTSDRTGNKEVYVMRLDGSAVRNISRDPGEDWATSWQPQR